MTPKSELYTAVKYGLVGIANTALFSVLAWSLSKTGAHYAVYTTIAYILSIIFSFFMNRHFTFDVGHSVSTGRMFISFVLVTGTALVVAQLVQAVLIEAAGAQEWVAVGSGMVSYTGCGYAGNRLWTFNQSTRTSDTPT